MIPKTTMLWHFSDKNLCFFLLKVWKKLVKTGPLRKSTNCIVNKLNMSQIWHSLELAINYHSNHSSNFWKCAKIVRSARCVSDHINEWHQEPRWKNWFYLHLFRGHSSNKVKSSDFIAIRQNIWWLLTLWCLELSDNNNVKYFAVMIFIRYYTYLHI